MPSLKLSNPFRRGADRPSLKERAATLRATAGRVMSGAQPDPKAVPDVPDARAFAVEQAALIDLSALSVTQLGVLFDRFDAASNAWCAELHLPYANGSKGEFRVNTAAGDLLEREQERVAEIRDRIAVEIDRRQPANERDANTQLETLIRHELMCNGDLRDPAIRARIEATWGDVPAHDAAAESMAHPMPTGPEPAASLLAMGREFDAAHATWRKAVEGYREPNRRYGAHVEAAKARGGLTMEDIQAAEAESAIAPFAEAEDAAFDAVSSIGLDILRRPARTVVDLATQARAVIPHVWPRGTYEADAALAPDEDIDREAVRLLIKSCCAAAGVDWHGTPVSRVPAAGPADDGGRGQQNPLGDLLAGLDLSALPMRTLSALHDHVRTLNNICYGLAAQPCSLNRDEMLNEAGTVMYRLTEQLLQRASDACLSEARRRASATDDDRDIRLAMLAREIIENDDRGEIRAIARDLLVMTEA